MKKVIRLKNLGCANCAAKMEREIGRIDGVNNASVNFITQKLTFETEETSLEDIMESVEKIIKKIEPSCSLNV